MNKKTNLFQMTWDIIYPVGMYYATITIGILVAQLVFGTSIENYMLCKIIGSLVALPVVYTEYKTDLKRRGLYGKKWTLTKDMLVNIMLVCLISICFSIALNNIITMSPLVEVSVEYQNASNAFYGSTIGLELLGSALITPMLEELLHRGVVYGRLRQMMNMWPAVFVSAFIFAMLHFNIVQFTYAFLLGSVFAIFMEKTGHVYPAIIGHVVANGIAVIRTETGILSTTVDGSAFAWSVSVVLCLIGSVGLVGYIRRKA